MFWSIWCNERWVGLDAAGVGPPPARWLASGSYLPAAARLTTSGIDAAAVASRVIDWITPASPSPVTFSVGVTRASALQLYRSVCAFFPKHEEPASSHTRVRSAVPLLALVGGADPQDPIGNLRGLVDAMPKSRVVVVPAQGHAIGQLGCLPDLVARFVERGGAASLNVRCAWAIPAPSFLLR